MAHVRIRWSLGGQPAVTARQSPNRQMRTRTSGRVGGERWTPTAPYPDWRSPDPGAQFTINARAAAMRRLAGRLLDNFLELA